MYHYRSGESGGVHPGTTVASAGLVFLLFALHSQFHSFFPGAKTPGFQVFRVVPVKGFPPFH